MISLICGLNSKFPWSALCLGDKLTDLSTDYLLCTTADMEGVYKSSVAMNAADSEELLKNYGLCAVLVTLNKFSTQEYLFTYFLECFLEISTY